MFLLLLLLLIKENEKMLHYYFKKLKTEAEREACLRKLADPGLIRLLKELTELFIGHAFYDPEIIRLIKPDLLRQGLDAKRMSSIVKEITEWQKYFYLNAIREMKETGKCSYYDRMVEMGNKSFLYLISSDIDEAELLFLSLSIKSGKKRMAKKDLQSLRLRRILKAASMKNQHS